MAPMQRHWDIFCRIIDNFGDIGVCWRLARQLAGEHGLRVRLWVDDPASLQPLCPTFDPMQDGLLHQGVEIRRWSDAFEFDEVADVVIEAFACELPPAYIDAMARRIPRPCWLNLEYLSAEAWVADWHGMASPHPSLPLVKHFVFPGFFPSTAGLLRERELLEARDAFQATQAPRDHLEISLFCYETAPVADLLAALAASRQPVICHVPPGKPLDAVRSALGGGEGPWQLGLTRIAPLPFLAMDDYDRLLWRCDINFVRGEDSFVRAQWAGRPFIWQIYRQDEEAHLPKLEAFLDLYCAGAPSELASAIRSTFLAWNTGSGFAAAWPALVTQLDRLQVHNRTRAARLATMPDLASSLVNFCAAKV